MAFVARRRNSAGGQGNHVRGGHVEIEAPLSDVIERNADGTFILHGRAADMVNIAGKRTSLASLNHHLNEIPGVQDGVFFMPDERDGAMQRPLAFVVAPGLRSEDILGALRNSVDAVFLPRPLYIVETLPRNTTGKLTRESLVQMMATLCKEMNRLTLAFAANHPAGAGHFPGNPILPGALLLAEVLRCIEQCRRREYSVMQCQSGQVPASGAAGRYGRDRIFAYRRRARSNFVCAVAGTRVLSGGRECNASA